MSPRTFSSSEDDLPRSPSSLGEPGSPLGTALTRICRTRTWKGGEEALRLADELREGLTVSVAPSEEGETRQQGSTGVAASGFLQGDLDALSVLVGDGEVELAEGLAQEPGSPLGTALRRISQARAWHGSGHALRMANELREGLADSVAALEARELQDQHPTMLMPCGLTQNELDTLSVGEGEAGPAAEPAQASSLEGAFGDSQVSGGELSIGSMLLRLRRTRAFEGEAKRTVLKALLEAESLGESGNDSCTQEAPDTSEGSESECPCSCGAKIEEAIHLMKRRHAFCGEAATRDTVASLIGKACVPQGLGANCVTQEELDSLCVEEDEGPTATATSATTESEELCEKAEDREGRSASPLVRGEGKADSPCNRLKAPMCSPRRLSRSPGRGGA